MLSSDIDLKFKVEQAENMSMSIRPRSGGLTFVIYEGQDFDEVLQEGFLALESSPKTWSERISDLFFTYSFLALPFHRVKLCYEPIQTLILPKELYQEELDELWLSYINSDEELVCLKEGLDNEAKYMLFYYPKSLYNFLMRTHIRLEAEAYVQPLIQQDKRYSRQQGKACLCLSLRYGHLDAWLIRQGELSFFNSYNILEPQSAEAIEGELMYYLFMLVGELSLNLEKDELKLYVAQGDSPAVQSLLQQAMGLLSQDLSERLPNYNK